MTNTDELLVQGILAYYSEANRNEPVLNIDNIRWQVDLGKACIDVQVPGREDAWVWGAQEARYIRWTVQ
jgi:hypothetical protein